MFWKKVNTSVLRQTLLRLTKTITVFSNSLGKSDFKEESKKEGSAYPRTFVKLDTYIFSLKGLSLIIEPFLPGDMG